MINLLNRFLVVFFIFLGVNSMAQTAVQLTPVLVSCGGGYVQTTGVSWSYSIGEPMVETITDNSNGFLTQGFQQPFDVVIVDTTKAPVFYTGISPNGDGVNDQWIIDNIGNQPKNTVSIFDRWGNNVFSGKGYNNTSVVWKGKDKDDKALPGGTYFYVVTVEGKGDIAKGWVEVTKK